jgi:hypothetical protein
MIKSTAPIAVVCISVGFAAALLVTSGSAPAVNADCPGEPGTPCNNGDVNADGELNISDAVYLLKYLFLGGPEPLGISSEPCSPPSLLPATGQTWCYDTSGILVDCAGATCAGQDGLYALGCPWRGASSTTRTAR